VRNRHHADCRVAVERAADRYTLICDGRYFSATSRPTMLPPGEPQAAAGWLVHTAGAVPSGVFTCDLPVAEYGAEVRR
jgi:hypothetical protein